VPAAESTSFVSCMVVALEVSITGMLRVQVEVEHSSETTSQVHATAPPAAPQWLFLVPVSISRVRPLGSRECLAVRLRFVMGHGREEFVSSRLQEASWSTRTCRDTAYLMIVK
jgi:hypothetical protein